MSLSAEAFARILSDFVHQDFILQSRIHAANTYFSPDVFIKRDDELSSGVIGGKYRKFASVIQHIIKEKYDDTWVIGSANANNVLAAAQLFREFGIKAKYLLSPPKDENSAGNYSLFRLIAAEENIVLIPGKTPAEMSYDAAEQIKNSAEKIYLLPEGCEVKEAVFGAMTLAADIVAYTIKNKTEFSRIFIDSGSGISAIGLVLGMAFMGFSLPIIITLIAGTEEEFRYKTSAYKKEMEAELNCNITELPELIFTKPLFAASFGAVNAKVKEELAAIARTEGILAEPLYTVKHFASAKEYIEAHPHKGKSLIINNGGALGLYGFKDKFAG